MIQVQAEGMDLGFSAQIVRAAEGAIRGLRSGRKFRVMAG